MTEIQLYGGPLDGAIIQLPEGNPPVIYVPDDYTKRYDWPTGCNYHRRDDGIYRSSQEHQQITDA